MSISIIDFFKSGGDYQCPHCEQVGYCFVDEDEDNHNNLWCNYCGTPTETEEGVEVRA